MHAIEHVLAKAPLSHNLIIVTDSFNSIQRIESALHNPNSEHNIEHNIAKVINLIKIRETHGFNTQFTHVFSHIEQKQKEWSPEKLKNIEAQAETFKNLFQIENAFAIAEKGNIEADTLATSSLQLEDEPHTPIS